MITNERQRRVAVGEKARFEQAIARARTEGPGADVHPALHNARTTRCEPAASRDAYSARSVSSPTS
jgi:hypothetical protein